MMTESDWLTSSDPSRLVSFLGPGASARKFRLFACACVRLVWGRVTNAHLRRGVEVAERCADGEATEDELRSAFEETLHFRALGGGYPAVLAMIPDAYAAAYLLVTPQAPYGGGAGFAYYSDFDEEEAQEWKTYGAAHAALLRDVFGNPLRPAGFDARWRTPAVTGLAWAAYEDRAFDRLPILADALEEAGCPDAELLGHLRGPGPHTRGCWALDLVRGAG